MQVGQVCLLPAQADRAAFSPDGELLACISSTRVQVWKVNSGALLWEARAPWAEERAGLLLTGIEFTDLAIAGDVLVTVLTDGSLVEWDLRTGEELRTALVPEDRNRIAISPDGVWLAVNAYLAGETFIWDRASWELVAVLPRTRGPVVFNSAGDLLLVGGADGTPQLVEVGDWQRVRELTPLPGLLTAASFSPDGNYLALAGWDSLVWVYEVASGELIHSLAGHREPVSALVFSPDGRVLVSGGRDELVLVWGAASGELLARLDLWSALGLHEDAHLTFQAAVRRGLRVSDLDFRPGSGILATCGVGAPALGWLQLWWLADLW
jgi:WD40 repeat protein